MITILSECEFGIKKIIFLFQYLGSPFSYSTRYKKKSETTVKNQPTFDSPRQSVIDHRPPPEQRAMCLSRAPKSPSDTQNMHLREGRPAPRVLIKWCPLPLCGWIVRRRIAAERNRSYRAFQIATIASYTFMTGRGCVSRIRGCKVQFEYDLTYYKVSVWCFY